MARPRAIHSLQETTFKGNFNWLIYGDSGAGKTVLAGTAPESLFLTVEAAGTESARMRGSKASEWVIHSWEELLQARDWLRKEGHREFEWGNLDSISELEELCFPFVMEMQRKKNKNRSAEVPGMDTYQIVYIKMKNIIDDFNRLPMNMLYTAQSMRLVTTDEDGDESTLLLPLVGSQRNGTVAQKICGKTTLVGYLNVQEGDKKNPEMRRLWTAKTARMFAKDRHDTFGRYVDNPDIAEMVEAVTSRGSEKPSGAKKKKAKSKGA